MYDQLTLQEKLKDERINLKMTMAEAEAATGISTSSISTYENTESDSSAFSPYAISKLAKLYNVSMDYLYGLIETKNHPNTDLYDLHLDDKTIDILKNGTFNHRLLCEFLSHPDFANFLTDMEIYVDGIISSQIQQLDLLTLVTREKILNEFQPKEDTVLKTLEAVQIPEDDYFRHRISEDVGKIAIDIRRRHRDDPDNSSAGPVVETFRKLLDKFSEMKGTEIDKFVVLWCDAMGINSNRLTPNERNAFISICKKSRLFQKTRQSERGKKKKDR